MTSVKPQIDRLAHSCIDDMGDIFWDFDPARDTPMQLTDPRVVAIESIKKALTDFAEQLNRSTIYPSSLREEYKQLVSELPANPTDEALTGTLVKNADWTGHGAQTILHLAREYGCAILRNALALAEAMDIQDGNSGL